MNGIRRAVVAAALALLAPLPLAVTAVAAPPQAAAQATWAQLSLPRPTGHYAVGRDVLHLVDQHRKDPWVPGAGARQLMVSMYYPAQAGTGGPAPYMSEEEARLLVKGQMPGHAIPAKVVSSTRTWARDGARPVRGRFPLVVLSPGHNLPRATLSGLAEELTSHGYVVALVDHTYEAFGVTLPDGRTLPCACEVVERAGPKPVVRARVSDISLALDQLTGRHPAWRHAGLIDPRRIGMAGHSLGGDATALTMAADHRVRAGANLDGTFFVHVPAGALRHRPFLLLGNQAQMSPGMPGSWDADWPRLDGWKRWLTVAGAHHTGFTDLDLLYSELGKPTSPGDTTGLREEQITRTYLTAYFDQQLKGRHQRLLDGPSAANPEVTVQHP
ncbi:alpha/beta hydrolase family protein [Streptomyces sp. NPDC052396]|uniref:alpha/beta hydrolase family protein n=1 Tax=Streptomyces sp. NPDC052396 TaxID=3365689 RepID=UPI0037D4195A